MDLLASASEAQWSVEGSLNTMVSRVFLLTRFIEENSSCQLVVNSSTNEMVQIKLIRDIEAIMQVLLELYCRM